MSIGIWQRPIANGLTAACQLRLNGRRLRAAMMLAHIHGEVVNPIIIWRTMTVTILPRLAHIQMVSVLMVLWIWEGMSGNGLQIGIVKIIMKFHLSQTPLVLTLEIVVFKGAAHGPGLLLICALHSVTGGRLLGESKMLASGAR